MTHTEVIEQLADIVGSSYVEAHGFAQTFIDIVISHLDSGDEVKIRGLGTFKWVEAKGRKIPVADEEGRTALLKIPSGKKLKFIPATKLRTRRTRMSEDEGMNKYAVVMEGESNDKTASDDTVRICPICGSELDDGGACPKHGTEPFESHE